MRCSVRRPAFAVAIDAPGGRCGWVVRPNQSFMGVESNFYILPETSGYRPEPARVCQLVKDLRGAGFLCDPKSPTFTVSAHRAGSLSSEADYEGFCWKLRAGPEKDVGSLSTLELRLVDSQESDVLVQWPNSDLNLSGLKYPLSMVPGPEGVYYDIEIHLAAQTVYHTSEIIDPFDEIRCSCGADVQQFDPSGRCHFYDSRLPNRCPACQMVMNYATLPLTIRDGWTGVESGAVGGVTYRFALVVDCGKYWPESEAAVTPEFLAVVEQTLGIKTRVFRDFY